MAQKKNSVPKSGFPTMSCVALGISLMIAICNAWPVVRLYVGDPFDWYEAHGHFWLCVIVSSPALVLACAVAAIEASRKRSWFRASALGVSMLVLLGCVALWIYLIQA